LGNERHKTALIICDRPEARRLIFTYAAIAFIGVVVALAGHILYQFNDQLSDQFSLYRDHGYAEFFQYFLASVTAIALLVVSIKRRQSVYALLSVIMAYIFLDDVLHAHERVGAFLASERPFVAPLGIEVMHVGEAWYLGIVSVVILGCLIFAFFHADQERRRDLSVFIAILGLAGVFGILFDALHAFTKNEISGILEDGGELASIALLSIFSIDRAAAALLSRRLPDDVGNNRHDD